MSQQKYFHFFHPNPTSFWHSALTFALLFLRFSLHFWPDYKNELRFWSICMKSEAFTSTTIPIREMVALGSKPTTPSSFCLQTSLTMAGGNAKKEKRGTRQSSEAKKLWKSSETTPFNVNFQVEWGRDVYCENLNRPQRKRESAFQRQWSWGLHRVH